MVFELMNVTFHGYLILTCAACKKTHTLESKELRFEQDSSPEAEDDPYIRYLTQVDASCDACAAELHVELDVWEHPDAVTNYSYHSEQGTNDIQCEFTVEHYFDDSDAQEGVAVSDSVTDLEANGDDGNTRDAEDEVNFESGETTFNETSDHDGYKDHYKDHYDDDN